MLSSHAAGLMITSIGRLYLSHNTFLKLSLIDDIPMAGSFQVRQIADVNIDYLPSEAPPRMKIARASPIARGFETDQLAHAFGHRRAAQRVKDHHQVYHNVFAG